MHFPKLKTDKELAEFCRKYKWACKMTKHEICKRILKDNGYKVGIGFNYCRIYNELELIHSKSMSVQDYCDKYRCSLKLYDFLKYNNITVKIYRNDYDTNVVKFLEKFGYKFDTRSGSYILEDFSFDDNEILELATLQ